MGRSCWRGLALLLVAASACPGAAPARSSTDVAQSPSIAGVVLDTGGQPIPGVSITATEASSRVARSSTSAEDGGYRFDILPDRMYRVDFALAGFDLVRRNNVHVSGGATARADATMWIAGICECLSMERRLLRERAGRVVDPSARPLPCARVEVVTPRGAVATLTDRSGAFRVLVPVDGAWPLTASDSGFSAVTQQVSGAADATIVFALPSAGSTALPYSERFSRTCRCPEVFLQPAC